MKKLTVWILALACALVLAGCSAEDETAANGTPVTVVDGAMAEVEEKWDRIPMVMIDGVLYLDTGHSGAAIRKCGTFEGEITSAVDGSEQPTENDQSNFGTGYGYQYGAAEGTVELYMNGKWRIFATEETREKIQFPDRYAETDDETVPDSAIPGATTFIVDIYDRAEEEQIPCAEAMERFYEDETSAYYFSCIKSHYIMVADNTGRTVDIITALEEGLATIADLDAYGIAYYTELKSETAEGYLSVPAFSYTQDRETYGEGEPGVKTSGFVNTAEAEIRGVAEANKRAERECTVSWDTVTTNYDAAAGVWKVVFSTRGTLGGCQSVYLRDDGTTALIVYGE